jgi:hypothetical protein
MKQACASCRAQGWPSAGACSRISNSQFETDRRRLFLIISETLSADGTAPGTLCAARAGSAKLYPPDGQEKVWWDRLKKALGTSSSDFVNASLHQLQRAAQFPGSGICEVGINAALAMIEGFAPRNEMDAALAVQMACTHGAAMSVLGRLGPAGGTEDHVCRFAAAAARLLRAFTTQFEAYRRLRHGGDQYVRVEHVHIHQGAQAVIGNVHPQDNGQEQSPETQVRPDPDEAAP